MTGERRANERCPVCQGPTKPDPSMPEGIRCRRSTCSYNHETVECPRCGSKNKKSIEVAGEGFKYNCADCQKTYIIN